MLKQWLKSLLIGLHHAPPHLSNCQKQLLHQRSLLKIKVLMLASEGLFTRKRPFRAMLNVHQIVSPFGTHVCNVLAVNPKPGFE